MDLVDYSLKQEELKTVIKRLEDFRNSLLVELVVLMDDGGRLVAYAPYTDAFKPIAYRVSIVGAATVGAVDQLESIISSKKNMFFAGTQKNMYVHIINPKFMLASVFSHKVPLGSVKLFKEKLSKELAPLLESVLNRKENKVVKFEDLVI